MGSPFGEVLQRAEQLIASCEMGLPPHRLSRSLPATPDQKTSPKLERSRYGSPEDSRSREAWPPERPPGTPLRLEQAPLQLVETAEQLLLKSQLAFSPWPSHLGPAVSATSLSPTLAAASVDAGAPAGSPARAAPSPRQTPAAGPSRAATPGGGPSASAAARAEAEAAADRAADEHLGGLRGVEVSVLLDGLERENALLRQQLERVAAREKSYRADAEALRGQLDEHARGSERRREAESAPLAAEIQQQRSLVEAARARAESLQGEVSERDARLRQLEAEVAAAQAAAAGLTHDLDGLQQFVLPGSPGDLGHDPRSDAGKTPLLAALASARRAVPRNRQAFEARMETLGLMRRQLRGRLEATAATTAPPGVPPGRSLSAPTAAAPASETSSGKEAAAAAAASAAAAAAAAADADAQRAAAERLRAELEEARCEAAEEKARAVEAAQLLEEREAGHLQAARELEACRRSLKVRDAEVRELQLIGKYFSARSSKPTSGEMDVAALADELRGRCDGLAEEVRQLRAERDVLRAELELRAKVQY